jgi:xylulokinase
MTNDTPLVLGIDLGTSSVRAVLVDRHGSVATTAARAYPVLSRRPGWSEQNPDDWWRGTCEAVKEALSSVPGSRVECVGFSGQMHGTVLVDSEGAPTRDAIIWADQRSGELAQSFIGRIGRDRIGDLTANPLATGFQLATLLWLMQHEPDSLHGSAHVLLPKDYLRLRMTGDVATEATDACSTLLFDTAHREWSAEIVDIAGLDPDLLPRCGESTDRAGVVTPSAALELGIAAGTPVILGAADQPATAIGNGITEPGQLLSTIGSGGQLFAPLVKPEYDRDLRTHTFCHAIPDRWYAMGAILSAGLSLRWLKEKVLGPGAPDYTALTDEASTVGPGAEGLVFLPHLTGERTPHMDPDACGVFFGLTPRHDRSHLVRAVMEGVVFALADALDVMRVQGVSPHTVVAAGGGARSLLWKQIQADLFGVPVRTTSVSEHAGFGAALLAGVGAGWWPDPTEAVAETVRYDDDIIEPNPSVSEQYAELRGIYRELYPALRTLMARRRSIL